MQVTLTAFYLIMSSKLKQSKQQKRRQPNIKKGLRRSAVAKGLSSSNLSSGRLGLSGSGSKSTSRRAQVIEEDEYIAEVNGSVGFATTAYAINPGQQGTFPWAYKIAGLYEKYKFEMLEFYYKREVSEFATNGQAGKVMLSADYDASDSAPATKQQVEDTVPHIDGMPCTPQINLRLDCSQMANQDSKYVRPGAQPANTDIKTYDAGNFYISTYGCTNTSVVGELRVRYRCRLMVPVLENPVGGAAGLPGSSFLITSNPAGEPAAATTVYVAQFASATAPVLVNNSIGAVVASSGLITLLAGSYLIDFASVAVGSAVAMGNHAALYNSATSATGQITATIAGAQPTNFISAFAPDMLNSAGQYLWNTAVLGTTLALQVDDTYASGSAYNISSLHIVQL